MSEERKTADEDAVGEDDSRRQLWMRAGIAVGLIGLLLGGLAVFDYQSRPPPPEEEVVLPTKPIAPAKVAPEVTPEVGRDQPPDVVRAGSEAVPPPAAPVEEAPPPVLPPPARGGRAERLEPPTGVVDGGRPTERPAHTAAGAVGGAASAARVEPARKPTELAAPAVSVSPAQTVVAPQAKVTAPAAPAGTALPVAAAAPAARTAAAAPAQAVPEVASAPARKPAAPELPAAPAPKAAAEGALYLQLGVFPSAEQAEVLRARLSAAGVPSHLETRVLVGPFADRADALAAQARLRQKGFTPGDLIPFRR